MEGDFTLLGADIGKEDYDSARATLSGWLLTIESLDAVRESLGRPIGDSSACE